jgi:hypothetical protein
MMQDRYIEPHQARRRPSTEFESLFGDSLERAFALGTHDLAGLVEYLNRAGPPAMGGQPWTEASLEAELARLAQ